MKSTWSTRVLSLVLLMTLLLPAGMNTQASALTSPAQFDCGDVTEIPQTECEALVALYESTDGDNWTDNTGWLTTNTPCSWYGLGCSWGVNQLTNLYLADNKLSGPIPTEIGNLSALSVLGLHNNQLTGSIPSTIGNLTALTWLGLYNNQLSGPIPSEIGNLTALMTLNLRNNNLNDTIPSTIGSLTALTWMGLHNNQLSGSIPSEIGNLTALTSLSLYNNQLSGAIPSGIGNLTALTYLGLHNNQLSDAIPTNIGSLTALTTLNLGSNQLSDAIPTNIGSLTALTTLDLRSNQLSGPIPPEIGNLTALQSLELSNNQLSGPIPSEIGNLTNLTWLNLSKNWLSGVIPPEIGNLSSLTYLQLQWNQLSGAIIPEIGNLALLTSINLATNQLTGTIPAEIGDLTALTSLSLFNNELSGPIPPQIGYLAALTNLRLEENQLSGPIPSEIGTLTALREMHLYSNQLSGSLPPALGNLIALTKLYLHNNPFDSEIPATLTALPLDTFFFHNTSLCAPPTGEVLTWLNGIAELYSSGFICNQAPGSLSGTVTLTGTTPVPNVLVTVLLPTRATPWSVREWRQISTTQTIVDGTYQFINLGQGPGMNYRVRFNFPRFSEQYYNNHSNIDAATVITITPGVPRTGVDAILTPFDCTKVTEIPQTQCEALMALYESTDGDNWTGNTGWLMTNTPCSWYGVTCTSGNVMQLSLWNNQLSGPIPPEIGNLTALEMLWLGENQLSGEIPAEIGNLTALKYLYLSGNELSGPIPPEIGDLSALTWLELHNNPFSGEVSTALTPLTLEHFTFYDTDWCVPAEGDVPTWLTTIPNLYGTGFICGQDLGSLSGTVTLTDTAPASDVQVNLYRSRSQWGSWQHLTTTHTIADGTYQFTGLGQGLGIDYRVQFVDPTHHLAPQYYAAKPTIATADVITITPGVPRTGIDAVLALPQPPSAGVETESGSVAYNPDGTAQITMPAPNPSDITITRAVTCAMGTPDAVTLTLSTGPHYTMTNVSDDLYQATIPADDLTSNATLSVAATCGVTTTETTVGYITLYDPSGIVSDKQTGRLIEGATVTLYNVPGWEPKTGPDDDRTNTCQSHHSKDEGAPWDQPAPTDLGIVSNADVTPTAPNLPYQHTTADGYYGWDVSEGCWYVTIEAEGYESLTSPVVGVPPEVTDLDLQLTPLDTDCPFPLTGVGIDGPLDVAGSLYIDTLYTFQAVITPTNATEPITYTWSLEPQTGQGTNEVTYRWSTPDTYTVTLRAENCGDPLTTTQSIQIWARDDYIYLPLVLRNNP